MQVTIGQLLALIRMRIGPASNDMAINHSLKKLTQFEAQLGGMSSWKVDVPVKQEDGKLVDPPQSSGKSLPEPKEPVVEEKDVEVVEEDSEEPLSYRYSNKRKKLTTRTQEGDTEEK